MSSVSSCWIYGGMEIELLCIMHVDILGLQVKHVSYCRIAEFTTLSYSVNSVALSWIMPVVRVKTSKLQRVRWVSHVLMNAALRRQVSIDSLLLLLLLLTCICLRSRLFSYDLGHRTSTAHHRPFRDVTPWGCGGGEMNFIYCCWCRRSLSTVHRVLSVAMEMQFALLSFCEIFGIVVNNNKRSVLWVCVFVIWHEKRKLLLQQQASKNICMIRYFHP
jgi:hypothetical protein